MVFCTHLAFIILIIIMITIWAQFFLSLYGFSWRWAFVFSPLSDLISIASYSSNCGRSCCIFSVLLQIPTPHSTRCSRFRIGLRFYFSSVPFLHANKHAFYFINLRVPMYFACISDSVFGSLPFRKYPFHSRFIRWCFLNLEFGKSARNLAGSELGVCRCHYAYHLFFRLFAESCHVLGSYIHSTSIQPYTYTHIDLPKCTYICKWGCLSIFLSCFSQLYKLNKRPIHFTHMHIYTQQTPNYALVDTLSIRFFPDLYNMYLVIQETPKLRRNSGQISSAHSKANLQSRPHAQIWCESNLFSCFLAIPVLSPISIRKCVSSLSNWVKDASNTIPFSKHEYII